MPILNRNGKVLTDAEVRILAKMMKESLEDHAKISEQNVPIFLLGDQKDFGDIITKNYKEAIPDVDATFEKFSKSKENISMEETFQKVFAGVYEKSIKEGKSYNKEDIARAIETLLVNTGDDTQAKYYGEKYKVPENDEANIINTAADFSLAQEAMPGAAELTDFAPSSDRVVGLAVARMGNSTTYADLKDQMNRADKKELTDADKAMFGFYTASETAKVISADLMSKKNVGFTDLYDAFTSVNSILRTGDENGGKMRGNQVSAGSAIRGVGSAKCPAAMYNILDFIAENMNKIKKTADPALRKTQAIQLAAFTYQMTLSAHLFADANGRSCRILSDIVLQSFGLPPHTPSKEETTLCHSIGDGSLDFKKGAEVFMNGVQLSDKIVKEQKEAERAKADPQELARSEEAGRRAAEAQAELRSKQKYQVDRVDDALVKKFTDYRASVKKAKSSFHNSKEYEQFELMLDSYVSLVDTINKAKDVEKAEINLNDLNPVAKKIALAALNNDVAGNGVVDFEDAGKLMQTFCGFLTQCAQNYEQYKMKDHTLDPKAEPGKKLLNKDDIKKMNLIRTALGKPELPKNLYKENTKSKGNNGPALN